MGAFPCNIVGELAQQFYVEFKKDDQMYCIMCDLISPCILNSLLQKVIKSFDQNLYYESFWALTVSVCQISPGAQSIFTPQALLFSCGHATLV